MRPARIMSEQSGSPGRPRRREQERQGRERAACVTVQGREGHGAEWWAVNREAYGSQAGQVEGRDVTGGKGRRGGLQENCDRTGFSLRAMPRAAARRAGRDQAFSL